MKWVSYRSADGSTRCGVMRDNKIHAVGTGLLELLRAEGGLEAAATREPTEIVEAGHRRPAGTDTGTPGGPGLRRVRTSHQQRG